MPGARPSSERRERALTHRFTLRFSLESRRLSEKSALLDDLVCVFASFPPGKTSRNTELLPNTESRSCTHRVNTLSF